LRWLTIPQVRWWRSLMRSSGSTRPSHVGDTLASSSSICRCSFPSSARMPGTTCSALTSSNFGNTAPCNWGGGASGGAKPRASPGAAEGARACLRWAAEPVVRTSGAQRRARNAASARMRAFPARRRRAPSRSSGLTESSGLLANSFSASTTGASCLVSAASVAVAIVRVAKRDETGAVYSWACCGTRAGQDDLAAVKRVLAGQKRVAGAAEANWLACARCRDTMTVRARRNASLLWVKGAGCNRKRWQWTGCTVK
jgi:hypothetical protein